MKNKGLFLINGMKKMRATHVLLSLLMFVSIVMGGCANNSEPSSNNNSDNVEAEKNVVTVKILTPWDENLFKERFGNIDEKLTDIKLELISSPTDSESLQEINAKGIIPDIILASSGFDVVEDLDMVQPLDEMVEEHNVDLSKIDPSVLSLYKLWGNGKLVAIPSTVDNFVMFYNKQIFDLFGVPYPDPEQPMTWQQVVDLSRQLTGSRNGVDYVGFELMYGNTVPLKEFALNYTNPETGEVLITEQPEVTQYFELIKEFYDIPGLYDPKAAAEEVNAFGEGRAAMTVSWPGFMNWGIGEDFVLDIDFAPVPVWENNPNKPPSYSHPFVLNKHSENKEAAFKVLAEELSVESQTKLSKSGEFPSVLYDETLEAFGGDNERFTGKNIPAIYSGEPAIYMELSKWDQYVDFADALLKFAESGKDIPTFLRELAEESEAKIKEAMVNDQ
ncbi:extracellular solute-binding protein [Lederbergia sp. NSJ-179]|uniref:ABC transporter substrate-binding protein n=1 Tax=Lederbergia sp. NSJ-179 TaxID=2931402 RepID=UPI001FD32FCA|nr:extracellular solute-binding protein [Lederbergia sp. NSJ-179]MCJ7840614.1 extracellular solute-binding protein [Lederbergia sp. NSJ-179]